jgi:prevent-host-death family protein
MKEIAISKFKAKCLGILDQVNKTKKPVRVTRFGQPVVDVFPAAVRKRKDTWLGCMAGTVQIKGDLVAPATDEDEWEVLSE